MKNYIIILFVIQFGLISCQNKSVDKKNESSKLEIKTPEIIQKNSNPIFTQNDFELVYEYSNGEDNQLLGINFVDKKIIKFHLVTKTLPCDTEYWGIAKNKYSDFASEIDEDENGTAYGANEYIKNEVAEYTIAIRLALDSSKVIIKYVQEDGLETDCLPIPEKIMNRIK
jgi:hypothetical protein